MPAHVLHAATARAVVIALATLVGGGAGLGVRTLAGRSGDTNRTTAAGTSAPTPPPGGEPGCVRSEDPAGFTVDAN